MGDKISLPVNYERINSFERQNVRNQYVKDQRGLCYHCKKPLDGPSNKGKRRINWNNFPPNFLKYPVHLHHCHETGMTIGAVHSICNAHLWQFHGE